MLSICMVASADTIIVIKSKPTEQPTEINTTPGFRFSEPEYDVYLGKQISLSNELVNRPSGQMVWESSDETIVRVNTNGYVTPVKEGDVTISVYIKGEESNVASSLVHVRVPVNKITINEKNATLTLGLDEKIRLHISVSPDNAFVKTASWKSSNEKVATVNSKGLVKACGVGTATITATSKDPYNKRTAQITVRVNQAVTGLSLQEKVTVAINTTSQLVPTISPSNATNKQLVWSSDNEKIATVNNGYVKGLANGTTIVRAKASDGSGLEASCEISVVVPVTSVKIEETSLNVPIHSTSSSIKFEVSPKNATIKTVSWSSSDESIATVDSKGKVTGKKGGTVTITATSNETPANGKPKSASIKVTVVEPVSTIKLAESEIKMAKGSTKRLTPTVIPKSATIQTVSWTSSKPEIASVSANGQITAKKVGKTTITCTATDGSGVKSTCTVVVIQGVTSLSPTKQRIVITEGKTASASVNVFPKDATNKKVTWKSESPSIASVNENGVITAKKAGNCVIRATSTDGTNRSTTINVVVEPKIPLEAITFTRSGYFGAYYEFAITFKNLTKTRTIKYISFDLKYTYDGKTLTYSNFYTDDESLGPGNSKQIGWWDQIGYRLSYCSNFRVYLNSVKYSDGTWDYFTDDILLGWFN